MMKQTPLLPGHYYRIYNRGNILEQFSHFFNANTQAINKRHHRTGSLFEKNFERRLIDSQSYNLNFYIPNNPVHPGFCNPISEYPWSSYGSVLSKKPSKMERKIIIELFDNLENFKAYHYINHDLENIRDIMIE